MMLKGHWIAAVICMFNVVMITSWGHGEAPGANSTTNIVVMTNAVPEYQDRLIEDAVLTICEELQINGFNVIRVDSSKKLKLSLKRTIGEAFERHDTSLAVVVFQNSVTDGTVMLFSQNGLDGGVTNLDSTYIELPLDKDKAEVVAFQVSEKASLLFDGMKLSISPVEIENNALPNDAEASANGDNTDRENANTTATSHLKWGRFLGVAGEYAPGGTGAMAGGNAGIRWRPVLNKAIDLEIKGYLWGKSFGNSGIEANINFFAAKLRGAHIFTFAQRLLIGIGMNVGVGIVSARGSNGSYVADSFEVQSTPIKKAVFLFGASTEVGLKLNEQVVIPLRFEAGGVLPEYNIKFEQDGVDILDEKQRFSFGYFLAELTLTIMIYFK